MEKEVFKELLKSTASKLGKTLPEFMVTVKEYFNLEVDRLGIVSPTNETDKMEVLILVCQNLNKNLKFYDLYSELLKIYDKLYEPFAINEFKQFQLHDDGKIVSSVRGETLLDKYWIAVDANRYGYSVMIGQKTNDIGNAGTSMNTFYNEILTFDELMSTDFKQIVENERIRSKEKMSEFEEKSSNKNIEINESTIKPIVDKIKTIFTVTKVELNKLHKFEIIGNVGNILISAFGNDFNEINTSIYEKFYTGLNRIYSEILTIDKFLELDFLSIDDRVNNSFLNEKQQIQKLKSTVSSTQQTQIQNEIQPTTNKEYRKDFAKRYNISEKAYNYFLNCASTFTWDKANNQLVNGTHSIKHITEIELLDELQQAKLLSYFVDEKNGKTVLFKLNALGFVEWEKYNTFLDEIHKQDAGETGSWSQKIVSQQQPKPISAIDLANKKRAENALDKIYRFPNGNYSYRTLIDTRDTIESVDFDGKNYGAKFVDNSQYIVPKAVYDYFVLKHGGEKIPVKTIQEIEKIPMRLNVSDFQIKQILWGLQNYKISIDNKEEIIDDILGWFEDTPKDYFSGDIDKSQYEFFANELYEKVVAYNNVENILPKNQVVSQQSAFNEILNKPLQSIVTPTQEIAVQAEILQKNIDDKKQQIEKPFQDTSETSIEDEDVPTSNYYKINDEGKLEMYFDFSDYKNLSEADKKEIKSKFLWSNQRKCWVSRIKNGIYVKDIAKKHNLKYVGREERISFAEQIERKEERAENKIERYETYSMNATKRAANLRSAFDKMRGDWSWLTQPNINSARGRAFTNSRERVYNSLNKSYEENNKAAYYADKAKLANDVLTKPELKDVHYLQNRIKEATTGIRQLEKNIPETQAALEKAIETGKDSWGRELTDERKEQITDWLENSMINLKLYYEKLAYYSMAMENLKAVKEESGEIVFDKPKIIEIAKTTKKLFKEKLGLDVKISSSQSTINVRWGTITDKTLYNKIVQMFYNAKSASEKEYKRGLFSYLNFWYGETGVDAGAATLNEFNKLLSTETFQ